MQAQAWIRNIKNRLFPKGVKRSVKKVTRPVFARSTVGKLCRTLEPLQIPAGSCVCVHSRLSDLGHLVGGPESILHALRQVVPDVTIMMPTFIFEGQCQKWLATNPIYDPQSSPSASGLLTDRLWRQPGARRSLHATHPSCALGPAAAALIEGSENAATPFGADSTYGRYSARDDAVLLLLHTNNTSLVHRFQEIAGTPNLYLEGEWQARVRDEAGDIHSYRACVHRPRIPLYVIMRGDREDERVYVWLPDYSLPMPDYNRERMDRVLPSRRVRDFLYQRHADFVAAGILRSSFLRNAEFTAIQVPPFQERVCADMRDSYTEFASDYRLEAMQAAEAGGLLRKM